MPSSARAPSSKPAARPATRLQRSPSPASASLRGAARDQLASPLARRRGTDGSPPSWLSVLQQPSLSPFRVVKESPVKRCARDHSSRPWKSLVRFPAGRMLARVLLGRASECAQLDELLAAARDGRSGSLVLRGEA